jgi:hypothetical protein
LKGESRSEYQKHLRALQREKQPEGILETATVKIAALFLWKFWQVQIAEVQAIEEGVLIGNTQRTRIYEITVEFEPPPASRNDVTPSNIDFSKPIRQEVPLPPVRPITDERRVILYMNYTTHLWRMYERAMDRLEKLQRIRRGQPVPEINVRVTK